MAGRRSASGTSPTVRKDGNDACSTRMGSGSRTFTNDKLMGAAPFPLRLVSEGTLFAHIDPALTGAVPCRAQTVRRRNRMPASGTCSETAAGDRARRVKAVS